MPDPASLAETCVRERWQEICDELGRIGVALLPDDVFEPPAVQHGETIRISPLKTSRVRLAVVEDIEHFADGKVLLDIVEKYSYHNLVADPTQSLQLLEYSYQLSYMPELLIESRSLRTNARSHWGDLLLTQRRFYRFDGEDQQQWSGKSPEYRNQHGVNHFHPGAGEHLRLPVVSKPSVLAVACYALNSFDYQRWLRYARADRQVLEATREILSHVAV